MSARTKEYDKSLIRTIRDKKTNKLCETFTLTYEADHWKMTVDGATVSRNNSLVVKYSCLTCGTIQEISQQQFMKKVATGSQKCGFCVDIATPRLTIEEFEKIRPFVKSVGHGKIRELTEWTYDGVSLRHPSGQAEHLLYCELECEMCGCIFTERELPKTTVCFECKKPKKHMQKYKGIHYRTTDEVRFIKWCVENSVVIVNAPAESGCLYSLPERKILVGIKTNPAMLIGLTKADTFASDWCLKNGYTYKIVCPKTMVAFKKHILS